MKAPITPAQRPPKSSNPLVENYEEQCKNLPAKSPSVASYLRVAYAEADELRVEAAKIISDHAGGKKRRCYRGRPTEYTQKVADRICEQIAQGYSLRGIVSFDPHVPGRATVHRWLRENPEFRDQYAQAQERRADAYFDMALEVACYEPDVQRARLIVDTLKWSAGRLSPKRYGRQVSAERDAPDSNAVSLMLKQLTSRPQILAELTGGEVSVERLLADFQLLGPSGSEANQPITNITTNQTTSVLRQDARIGTGSGHKTHHGNQ
jgi:hypothetical protein